MKITQIKLHNQDTITENEKNKPKTKLKTWKVNRQPVYVSCHGSSYIHLEKFRKPRRGYRARPVA